MPPRLGKSRRPHSVPPFPRHHNPIEANLEALEGSDQLKGFDQMNSPDEGNVDPINFMGSTWSWKMKENEEISERDRLLRMEAKLDRLTKQMNDALAGIRVLYRHGSNSHRRYSFAPIPEPHEDRPLPSEDVNMGGGGRLSSCSLQDLSVGSRTSLVSPTTGLRGPPFRAISFGEAISDRQAGQQRRLSIAGPSVVDEEEDLSNKDSWVLRKKRRGRVSLMVWNFIDNPDSSGAASMYNKFMPLFILFSVFVSLAFSVLPELYEKISLDVVDVVIETVFALEILTRYITCPNRWSFFLYSYNLIDMVSVCPLFFRLLQPDRFHPAHDPSSEVLTIAGFVPGVRLLKTWRRFEQIHLLTKAFKMAFEALPVMLFIYCVVWLFFTAAVLVVEDRSNIATLGQAMWLTFSAMTATTFGDIYPRSVGGKLIISMLVMISTLYMAIPIGIIGTCFSQVWTDRDKILLVERMRQVFRLNGFSAPDIPVLFNHFDPDGNGILSVEEFLDMATTLKLGLGEDRCLSLFQNIDNGSGGIDDKEFCKIIFPEAFYILYGAPGTSLQNQESPTKSWFPAFLL